MDDEPPDVTPIELTPVERLSEGVILAEIDGALERVMLVPPPVDGEVIRPVKEYCDALWQWLGLIVAKVEQAGPPPEDGWDDLAGFRRIAAAAPALRLAIRKSNYLYRRIYKGEPHRTEPCPAHQGIWSGCEFEANACACQSDVNITGWLPASSASEGSSRKPG